MRCWLVAVATLLSASSASAARVAVVVEGAGDRSPEIATALRAHVVGPGDEAVDAAAPDALLDDAALSRLREKIGATRVVVATVQRQGKDHFLVTVRAADAGGIARRFGDASGATLVDVVVAKAGDLPPLAAPSPPAVTATTPAATATAPAADATASAGPTTGTAAADAEAAPPPPKPPASQSPAGGHRRKHEYGLLIGGIVAFLVPWLATVGFAAHYLDYNPNASRLGFAPMVGPLLAKRKINDKDLGDGYDVGLTVDGAIQIVGTSVLIAGILYAAIGVPAKGDRAAAAPSWRPLLAAGPGGAQLGAQVSW